MSITVRYSAIDGFSKSRSFKTLAAARRFAVGYVGEHPEIGSYYAVAGDGVGKVTVRGATLAELFGGEAGSDYRIEAQFDGGDDVFYVVMLGDRKLGAYDTRREAEEHVYLAREDERTEAAFENPNWVGSRWHY